MTTTTPLSLCERLFNCFTHGYHLPVGTPLPGIADRVHNAWTSAKNAWNQASKCKKFGLVSAVVLLSAGTVAAIASSTTNQNNIITPTSSPFNTTNTTNQNSNICTATFEGQPLTIVKYNTTMRKPSIITNPLQARFQCFKLKMQTSTDKYDSTSFINNYNNSFYVLVNVLEYDSGLEPGENLISPIQQKNTCTLQKDNLPKGLAEVMKTYAQCKGGFDSNNRRKRDVPKPTQRMIKV